MRGNDASRLPLRGVRALELAEIWAGPFCGSLLGDLGAEVIKVESIQRVARGAVNPGPGAAGYAGGEPGERPWNRFANFNALSRNKLGVTLDLTSPQGVRVFAELANLSDVVFTNYAFGVMESFGLGYEALKRIKPDLVVVFMPGYGNTGPYKRYRSMGMTIDAITGHSALRGYPDLDLSSLTMVHHPDAVGGITAVVAVCTALYQRARTGRGAFIDISQAEAFMPHMGEIFLEHSMTGQDSERRGNRHPSMSPHGCYPCLGEDRWVTIAVRTDEEWQALREVTGMAADSRFSTAESRLAHEDELDALVAAWTSSLDRHEATRKLQARGIPAAPVLDCGPDTYDDPHLQERGYFEEVTHPDAGTHVLSGPIWRLAGVEGPVQRPAPCLGEHNRHVLRDILGMPESAMSRLEEQDIIGTVPLQGSDMGGVRRVARQGRARTKTRARASSPQPPRRG